jgi:non-heme chloroperoxidase
LTFRGHDTPGNRGRKMNRHSIGDYVQDVVDAVDKIRAESPEGTDDVVLVGHSMGGMVVQKYLEKHSCSVRFVLIHPYRL